LHGKLLSILNACANYRLPIIQMGFLRCSLQFCNFNFITIGLEDPKSAGKRRQKIVDLRKKHDTVKRTGNFFKGGKK
jgi:hypothetical protein